MLIVDDHPILLLGVRHLLSAAWPEAEIQEAQTLEAAVAHVQAKPFQLVVLDLSLPDAAGLEAPAKMLRAARNTPVLVLSLAAEEAHAERLLRMGVAGYLPKAQAGPELVNAARRVLSGQRYVSMDMTERLLGALGGPRGAAPASRPHEQLTAQEYRVMQLMAAGHSAAKIAEAMHLSVKTIGSYRARILAKTGWANNAELTKYCVQHGLTDPG